MAPRSAARRTARLLALAGALLLALAVTGAASATVAGRRAASASSTAAKSRRHARHTAARVHRHRARRRTAHKPRKAVKHASPALELLPAACEDGSLPSHAGGGAYSCEDGSAPACEEGTLRTGSAGQPMCAVKTGSEASCGREGGECPAGPEFDCTDTSEAEAPAGCERPEEAEGSEEEE